MSSSTVHLFSMLSVLCTSIIHILVQLHIHHLWTNSAFLLCLNSICIQCTCCYYICTAYSFSIPEIPSTSFIHVPTCSLHPLCIPSLCTSTLLNICLVPLQLSLDSPAPTTWPPISCYSADTHSTDPPVTAASSSSV